MKITYDEEANAFYLRMSDKKIKRTKIIGLRSINIDFDEDDEIIGVECLLTKERGV